LVDDSAFARLTFLRQWVARGWRVEAASDSSEALRLWPSLHPDLVTMDVEMPGLDGIRTVETMRRSGYRGPVIMVSGQRGAETVLHALAMGADDFVVKPSRPGAISAVVDDILARWRAIAGRRPTAADPVLSHDRWSTAGIGAFCIIASTGGPKALAQLFSGAPRPHAPVVIVQHMPEGFTQSLSLRLSHLAGWPILEVPPDGSEVSWDAAPAFLAPGGRHLRLSEEGLRATEGPRIHGVIPAADITLKDAARVFGRRLAVIVLTGMGEDGAEAARIAHQKGARVVAESSETAVVWGMPGAAVRAGAADRVWSLDRIRIWLHQAMQGEPGEPRGT
jgi:two-component system chemotaxis response regulator CheB